MSLRLDPKRAFAVNYWALIFAATIILSLGRAFVFADDPPPAENAPAENTPAENTPAENKPAESKPAETFKSRLKAAILDLEYSEQTADDVAALAAGWKCDELKQRLDQARQDLAEQKIDAAKVAAVEKAALGELYARLTRLCTSVELQYDLEKITKDHKANCFGFSQLYYVFGKAVGLDVKIIDVKELAFSKLSSKDAHVACFAPLADGKAIMADLSHRIFSKPFVLADEFTEDGEYWTLKNSSNPLRVHRSVHLLDRDEVLCTLYHCRETDCIKESRFAAAVALDDKAVALRPKDAKCYGRRGYLFAEMGDYEKSLADYDKAVELDHASKSYLSRAAALQRLRRYDESMADLDKAVELDPNNAEAYHYRGVVYGFAKKQNEAIEQYDKSLAIEKDAEVYCNRAIAYMNLDKNEEAKKDITSALALDPKNAHAYHLRGVSYAASGDLTEALPNLTQAIVLDPKYAPAYNYRGYVYHALNLCDDALADYSKFLSMSPNDSTAFFNRGSIYEQQEQYAEAIDDFTKGIALTPADADAYLYRGYAYLATGKNDEAIADFDKTVELDPAKEDVYLYRGFTHKLAGRRWKALADYLRAITSEPMNPSNYYAVVDLCFNSGRDAQAIHSQMRRELQPADATK